MSAENSDSAKSVEIPQTWAGKLNFLCENYNSGQQDKSTKYQGFGESHAHILMKLQARIV